MAAAHIEEAATLWPEDRTRADALSNYCVEPLVESHDSISASQAWIRISELLVKSTIKRYKSAVAEGVIYESRLYWTGDYGG